MAARSRLLLLPLVAVMLPSAVVAAIGYQWLHLEQDADARRSIEAADAESARLRRDLVAHLRELAVAIDRDWRDPDVRPPFADPVRLPETALAAFRLGADGTVLDPDYDGAYRRGIQAAQDASGDPAAPTARAAHLLRLGRVSLARRDYQRAASLAGQILDCCAATRDEYGYSFAIYSARQLAATWRGEGVLVERLADLARRLERLLDEGAIGHPADAADLRALVKGDVESPATAAVVRKADAAAARVDEATVLAGRLATWAAGLAPARQAATFSLATLRVSDRLHLLGVLAGAGQRALVVLYRLDHVGEWIATNARTVARFDAAFLVGTEPAGDRLSVPLTPETPGLRLSLRPRETDPALPARRRALFAGALAAVLAILGVVGAFALRDISREVRLASLRANFVASVTHELRTPLTSIRLLAETLALGRTRDAAVAGQLLQGIIDESDRLGHLVANVLAVARIDQGGEPAPRIETTARAAADAAVGRIGHLLRQRGFTLARHGDGASLHVRVDPDGLEQALVNLLENAVKYSGASREICLGLHGAGGEVEFRVTDHGIGIEPADRRRIFERFYRGASAAREAGGAGLGLSLVQHFAEAQGGRVTVSSEPGQGSTFSLWLPLAGPGAP